MSNTWTDPAARLPEDGEEVLAVVTGAHGGYRYDHEVRNAIYDHGNWYLDDGVVDEDEQRAFSVDGWMPRPEAARKDEPVLIDARDLLDRLMLISASAGLWSGPRVVNEIIAEVRKMIRACRKR